MQNHEYRPGRFDPLKEVDAVSAMGRLAMLPSFFLPSQASDCAARREAPRAASDRHDERLARAAYLSIVAIDRFVRAVASVVLRAGRYAMQQVSPRRPIRRPAPAKPARAIEVESSQ